MRISFKKWIAICALFLGGYSQPAHAKKSSPYAFLTGKKAKEHQTQQRGLRLHIAIQVALEAEHITVGVAPNVNFTIGQRAMSLWGFIDAYAYPKEGFLEDGLLPQEHSHIAANGVDRGSHLSLSYHWGGKRAHKWARQVTLSYYPFSATPMRLGRFLDMMWQPNDGFFTRMETLGTWSMELQWDIFRAFFALQLTNHMPNIRRFVAGMVSPKNSLRVTYPNTALHLEYNPQKWLGMYLHGAYFHDTYKQNPGTPVPPGWTAHLGFRWSLASNIQPVSFLSRRRKDPQALFTPYTLPQEKRRGLTIRAEGSVRSQQDESERVHTGQAYTLYLTGKISHLTLGAQFVWKSSLWHRQERTTYNNYELDAPLNVQPIWYIALDAAFRHHKTLQFALRISRFQPSFVTSTTQPSITNLPQVWYGPSFRYVALSDEHFALYTLHLQIRWSPTNAVTLALETWFTLNENNRFGFRDQITGRVFSVPKETPQIGAEVLLQGSF